MPWAFIPVLMVIALAPVPHVGWGPLVAMAISAWLGSRYGRPGFIAVAVAWAVISVRISVGSATFGLRWDFGLAAVLLSYLCAQPSPGPLVRQAVERAMQSRLAWLVAVAAPVYAQIPLVADQDRTYVGLAIGFGHLAVLSPLIAAAAGVPRTVYTPMIVFAVLSLVGRFLELGLPYPRWMPGRSQSITQLYGLYGVLGLDRIVVAIALGFVGHAIRCLADAKKAQGLAMIPALIMVALGCYEVSLIPASGGRLALTESTGFTAAGALLAGVVAGTLGLALAALVSTVSMGLLLGWIFTDAPWIKALEGTAEDAVFTVGTSAHLMIYLPLLAAFFGMVGAEVRATVLARRSRN